MADRLKRIVLGIGGGIAAYKAAEIVRLLRARNVEVRVILTKAAQALIQPLTFQALSGHPVGTELFESQGEAGMDHIELARWADTLLIAPATADLMARLACGLADDLLTTLALASEAPLYLAPAMNRAMWQHPATQANLHQLRRRGVQILGPGDGPQACGETGLGRMWAPEALVNALFPKDAGRLKGVRAVVTAGPTREALDPVRYLSNRSSGRMGFAVARALADRGAQVRLIHGPTCLPPPSVREIVRVESALEMETAVMERMGDCQLFAGVAAVADYRVARVAPQKIKKGADTLQLQLVKNPDILAEVASLPNRPFTVGFAAETENLEQHAREKLRKKKLDMIAANPVGQAGSGFECEENQLLVLWPGGGKALPAGPKDRLAEALVTLIEERYVAQITSEGAR